MRVSALALIGTVMILGVTALAGCSRAPQVTADSSPAAAFNNKTPVVGDWVIQALPADIDTLNPLTGNDSNGDMIRSFIFEGLLTINNFTLKLEPQLASSYEISPDQLVYTFHLRHDVKWQDGVPFTAEDVKYTYDRIQDPKVDAAPMRLYFDNIKSCEVLDPYTVRYTATERYFKTLEMIGTLPLIPKHILEKGDPDFNRHPFGRSPIGTGPYKFVRWDTGSQIVLERQNAYWGDSDHYPKRLVFEIITEPYVTAQLIKKSEVDVVENMSPLQWERELAGTRSAQRLKEVVYDYPAYYYLGFNLRKPIFSDVRVRHAIDLLVPRDEILKQIYLNRYGTETSGYDLPSSPSYNHEVAPTPYDPKLAAQLLREAGWTDSAGDGLLHKDGQTLSFNLLYRTGSPESEKEAELIQESLRSAGIDAKLSRLQFIQLIDKVQEWNFDSVILGWGLALNDDPYQIWDGSQATIKKSSNAIGYANPEADKLIATARLEYDDAKRAAIYRRLQKIIHDDYPVCFLFNPREILLVSNRFRNVQMFAPRPCFDISTWWVPEPLQKYR